MRVKRRRLVRVVLSSFLLLGSTLLAVTLGHGIQNEDANTGVVAQFDEPELNLHFGRQKLQLTLTSVSTEHEEAILQLIREQFDGVQARVDFRTGLVLRPDWDVTSERLLSLVGATSSAEASVDAGVINIRGVSANAQDYQQRLALLQESISDEDTVDSNVVMVDISPTATDLCARSFAAIAKQTIHFRLSGTQIRQSSYPVLDRIIEFAYDCREATVAIIGHTDSTGDEAWNLQLSRIRAQAVADYITGNGIGPERIIAEGRGSEEPIGDNDTVAGRERNRRIEFRLR